MSYTVTLKKKASSLYLANTPFCVWIYEVRFDDAVAAAAEIRLGFSAHIPIEHPTKHPQIAPLAGTKLVKEDGAAIQFVSRETETGERDAGVYEVALLAPCEGDEFTPIMLMIWGLPTADRVALGTRARAAGQGGDHSRHESKPADWPHSRHDGRAADRYCAGAKHRRPHRHEGRPSVSGARVGPRAAGLVGDPG